MQTNKTIDFALVGHNFFAFLLSLGLLKRGKKTLILDDDRFNYGDFFTNSLTSLDVEFLKVWGKESDLPPLQHIEKYLSPEKVYFYVGKKQVVLGDRPFRNYRELCRKFPELFLMPNSEEIPFDDFDVLYSEFTQKVSTLLFNEKSTRQMSKLFEGAIPKELQNRFGHFFSHFESKDKMNDVELGEFNSLIFMMRGFFQSRLAISGSRSEMKHLFFSLISPYYKLDHDKLMEDLLAIHVGLGGEFKKLNLSDLKFQKGLVESFALESFDGLIRPGKMVFIGGYPVGLPIRLKDAKTLSYNCLNVNFTFSEELPHLLKGKKCVFTSPMKIGTDRPFWEVFFGDKGATFNIIMAKKEGVKIDFIYNHVRDLLLADLSYLFPEYELKLQSADMKFTLDVFIEDKNFFSHKKSKATFKKKIVEVLEDTAPLLITRLKNVLYFGPYNDDSLGTFSSLVEMKRWRESL